MEEKLYTDVERYKSELDDVEKVHLPAAATYLSEERGVRMNPHRDIFLPAPAIEVAHQNSPSPYPVPRIHIQRHLQKTYSQPTNSIQST